MENPVENLENFEISTGIPDVQKRFTTCGKGPSRLHNSLTGGQKIMLRHQISAKKNYENVVKNLHFVRNRRRPESSFPDDRKIFVYSAKASRQVSFAHPYRI